jgi:hypothetical protein
MAAHNIELGSGDCESGNPGESAWWVPDGLTDETSPWRAGCFNAGDDNQANVSLVCHAGTPAAPSPVLYVSLVSFDAIEDIYPYVLGETSDGQRPQICDVFNSQERMLLDTYFGLGECAPLEGADLPREAQVAIECVIGDELVDRVGLYLFDSASDARNQYVQRLSQYDVALESGDCGNGVPGDSAWGDVKYGDAPGGPADSYWRSGCFVNENGHANVRLTCDPNSADQDDPRGVYVGVLGKSNELGKLFDWAWGDAGWRDYVTGIYEEHPNDPALGVTPAICTSGYFEP